MKYLILILILTGCESVVTPANASDKPTKIAVSASEKGDKGDKGDPGQDLKMSGSTNCSTDYLYSGTVYRLVLKKYVMNSGDIHAICSVLIKSKGTSDSEWTPAAKANNASCSVYYDIGGGANQNFGHWDFDLSNLSVTYHQDGGAANGMSYVFSNQECK